MIPLSYHYWITVSLRSALTSGRIDERFIVLDSDVPFEWRMMFVHCRYDLLVNIHLPNGPISNQPLHAFNLGTVQSPMRLVSPVMLAPGTKVKIELHNRFSEKRRWNRVTVMLIGDKQMPGDSILPENGSTSL
jgi:hypothetical protein